MSIKHCHLMEFYKAIKIFFFFFKGQVSRTLGRHTTHFRMTLHSILRPAPPHQVIGEYSQGLRYDNFPKLKANVD